MRSRYALCAVLLTVTITLAGCTAAQLRENADTLDRRADQVRQVAEDIEQGRADHADLIEALNRYVPEGLRDEVAEVVRIADDAPDAARDTAALMESLADQWREQADLDESRAENAIFGILSTTDALIGTHGLLAAVAGLFWARKRRSDAVAEDIVTSIQSSKTMRSAIDTGGGDELRKSMSPATMRAVRKIKSNT